MKRNSLIFTYIKLCFSAIFWGGTFIAGRIVSQGIDPFSAAFFRFAIASICLIILAKKLEGPLPIPKKHQIIPIFLLGLTGIVIYNICFFKGLELIEASRASVIVAQNPIFITLLSAYFFKEKLTLIKLLAVGFSVFGTTFVITRGELLELFTRGLGIGELYIFGCVISWLAYSLIGKAVMEGFSPLISVTYSVLIGTFLLSIPAFTQGAFSQFTLYSFDQWLSLVYLGIFGTVLGFLWFYQGIKKIGAMKAGMFINLVPISAVLLGFLILNEPLTTSLFIGLLCVSTGLYLMNKSNKKNILIRD